MASRLSKEVKRLKNNSRRLEAVDQMIESWKEFRAYGPENCLNSDCKVCRETRIACLKHTQEAVQMLIDLEIEEGRES